MLQFYDRWMLGIFLTGYKRDLQIDDLPEISKEYKSNYLGNKLSSSWRNELKRVEIKNFNGSTKNSLPNLVKALTTQPVALAAYIKYFSSAKKNSKNSTTENDAYIKWIGKKSSEFCHNIYEKTDERIRLTNEAISGIEVIKMYCWEYLFSDSIKNARNVEVDAMKSAYILRIFMSSLFHCMPRQSSNKLTASKIFMLIAYFEMIRVQMLFCFSKGILLFGETIASIKRIQNFMLYEEVNPETQLQNFKKAFAKWLDKDTLSNLNMVVEPGQLVAVIGPVGSGKSSLLSVILKELKVYQGNVDIQGNIAYACQEPWIFYGSVKNNIIFGRSLDQNRYKQVIKVCQLERDLQLLPYNDKTIVGQRGISLSGGQRARINFARAVYDDASIYLFDDSLSSVDTNVGKNMFNECIKKYLKGKTRILVTHQIEYLKNVDRIIFIKDGKIEADGNYDELIVKSINFKILSASLLSSNNEIESSIKNQDTIEHKTFYSVNLEPTLNDDTVRDNNEEPVEVEETQIKGKMETKLFLAYFGASGNSCLVYFVFLLIGATQILSSGGDWFIIYLIQDEKIYSNSTVTKW
ncbi:ATP-binding cassette sub-family C member 4-like [Aphidius gifuensis]|uniref:ATP-binding cassette sub-family C member 4-like n=1 Tax=Aphidius gifuensis TaxID=684658 RepID=UPI001CDBF2A0|nr:ATP-binding cassette sub-family C member 4-like [Aphidius gifuensis]